MTSLVMSLATFILRVRIQKSMNLRTTNCFCMCRKNIGKLLKILMKSYLPIVIQMLSKNNI